MAHLLLGPLLRYVGETDATIWVETDAPCEVEVLGRRTRTFAVEGHHYALVILEHLEPGSVTPYEVRLDGEPCWPHRGSPYPPSVIRTLDGGSRARIAFGSCRAWVPHEPPYDLSRDEDERGRANDALLALALRAAGQRPEDRPDIFLFLGDQVYADEVSPGVRDFIHRRRDPSVPPGEGVADFEEYTRLYWDSWRDPAVRWFLSTVSSSMIFDDHDVHDDWNTSAAWVAEMRAQDWWEERIVGGFMSYWVYQHLGNLSPRELREDGMLARVEAAGDGGRLLREFALRADREAAGTRWSFHRDLGGTRLVMIDSRAGRVLDGGRRQMVDDGEWEWIARHATGGFDHLLLGSSLPFLLAPALHHLEAWNEACCGGAWGPRFAELSERIRQELDLEHWAAFHESFERVRGLLEEVGAGRRGAAPATIVMLSGDVHHAYLAETAFRRSAGVRSAVHQAVCSPIRNPLDRRERTAMRIAGSPAALRLTRALSRAAGVPDSGMRWRLPERPTFDNQVATLELDGRSALLRIERTLPGPPHGSPRLRPGLERRLA